jgi:L-ascorbate metabolism protein UlaG (beta-lactamase superfamily)
MEELIKDLNWFGHASFYFVDKKGNKVYFVDPFQLINRAKEKADLIFITHAHPDHFSPSDIDQIIKPETIIIAPSDILEKIDIDNNKKIRVEPNKPYSVSGFNFSTIPAYNIHPDRLQFHPKANNWVGFIFDLNGRRVYHAGDTDFISEMQSLNKLKLDVAMLPVDGHYCMPVEEAAQAANAIAAKITIPIHYRRQNPDNYLKLEDKFKTLVTASKVVILEELK